jgi:hypothetical protein
MQKIKKSTMKKSSNCKSGTPPGLLPESFPQRTTAGTKAQQNNGIDAIQNPVVPAVIVI